jgi:GNAT superfamily N-acetyltransferase
VAIVIGPRFVIRGIEPAEVRKAPAAERKAFWLAVSQYVAEAKEAELKAGLDKDGNPMAELAKYTVEHRHSDMGPADPFAPALQPAHGLSRTRSLFRAQPTTRNDGVMCWWGYDPVTGESWGKMLAIHRAGGKHLPPRDVIGLSKASLADVKRKAAKWWKDYRAGAAKAAIPTFVPEIQPTPPPKFTVERVPAYVPKSPEKAIPKAKTRVSQIKINDRIYTMQSGTAEQVRRGIANQTFSGFGRVTPLPKGGPEAFAPASTPGAEFLKRSATATPIRAKVTVKGDVADFRKTLKKVAPKLRANDLADLAGASGEATVLAGVTSQGKVMATATARDYKVSVTITSKTTVRVTTLDVPLNRQGKGIGGEIMRQIIDKAEAAGFQRVTLKASRAADNAGYTVWPKYGFDGPLPASIRKILPEALKDAKTLGELLKLPGGRLWWSKNGVTIELVRKLQT